jgi:hypothetical protein
VNPQPAQPPPLPAFHSVDLDDTSPLFAADGEITQPLAIVAPLPAMPLGPPRGWLFRLRLRVAGWLSPFSRHELSAREQLVDAALVHYAAELHWQANCRDRAALRHWGHAQDAQAVAVEALLAVRGER